MLGFSNRGEATVLPVKARACRNKATWSCTLCPSQDCDVPSLISTLEPLRTLAIAGETYKCIPGVIMSFHSRVELWPNREDCWPQAWNWTRPCRTTAHSGCPARRWAGWTTHGVCIWGVRGRRQSGEEGSDRKCPCKVPSTVTRSVGTDSSRAGPPTHTPPPCAMHSVGDFHAHSLVSHCRSFCPSSSSPP